MATILTYALDDDISMIAALELKLHGITDIFTFTDEYQFIRALNDDVHICIIDHNLRQKTGLEVLRQVKERIPECLFIILSSQLDTEVVIEYLNERVFGYVNKNSGDSLIRVFNLIREGLELVKKRLVSEELVAQHKDKVKEILSRYENR